MLKVCCSGLQYVGKLYLYNTSDPSPQFLEMCLTLEDQLLGLVKDSCVFYTWVTILRHLLLL